MCQQRWGKACQSMSMSHRARRCARSLNMASAAAYVIGFEASFVTGLSLLMDGGVIAAMRAGRFDHSV
jgi:hypothetical protein